MSCSPLQTEAQRGQGVMEGSRRWEVLECVDLWKWQDDREDFTEFSVSAAGLPGAQEGH